MPSADKAASQSLPLPFNLLPLPGGGVSCHQTQPPSSHLLCDPHKAMQDGGFTGVGGFTAANGYFSGWIHCFSLIHAMFNPLQGGFDLSSVK